VEPVGPGGNGFARVVGETAEIGREDGGGKLRHGVIFSENPLPGKRVRLRQTRGPRPLGYARRS